MKLRRVHIKKIWVAKNGGLGRLREEFNLLSLHMDPSPVGTVCYQPLSDRFYLVFEMQYLQDLQENQDPFARQVYGDTVH